MLKTIKEYFGLYYLLYLGSFCSLYFFPSLTSLLNVALLLTSYQLILKRQRLDIIISLMLYSRCLNGFIVLHNKNAYLVINLLCNVLPILLYVFSTLRNEKTDFRRLNILSKYKFTFLFFLFLTVSFILNFSTATDLITKRYLPFTFFVLFLFFSSETKDFDVHGIIRFFRSVFFASFLVYFFSNYYGITKALVESDSVFSVASGKNAFSLVYMTFKRNMGFAFDHRITAIFAYLFLILTLVVKPKYFKLDILLSLIIVITSTSRGCMITYTLILFAYLFTVYRFKFVFVASLCTVILVTILYFGNNFLPPTATKFIQTFSPKSEYNALSQRKDFAEYAINTFVEKPILGNGVGFLSSSTIKRRLVIEGIKAQVVTDAYWYVLLAEMGIIGFLMFFLFLTELFHSVNILNIALLLGVIVQLLGTDIPDMRFYYFAMLLLVFIANRQMDINSKNNTVKLVHEN